jgi:2-desacetyl-2-hydroxyethyl bacteriochlorophyllide A dehydrogenase
MRALVIDAIGHSEMRDIPPPALADGEVLVSVRHVGLCGSDLSTFNGANPLVSLPRIPGHEIGGEIVRAGSGVPEGYTPGRRVTVLPYTSCGTCTSCRRGRVNACRYNRTLGVQQDGALTEFVALPADKVIPNDSLAPRHLPLVEPLSVGFHAVRRGRVAAGERVAVIGCGMIGMGVVIAAAETGAHVTAIDVSPAKLEVARRFGADATVDPAARPLAETVEQMTGGDGYDVVIEAVGSPATFLAAVDIACFSGRVVYIGYSKAPVSYDTKYFNLKELEIYGSRNATLADFETVIACLERLGDRADALISKSFSFPDAAEALPYWVANRSETLKIVITVPE